MKFITVSVAFVLLICTAKAQQNSTSNPDSRAEYDRKVAEENEKHGWGPGKLNVGDPAPDFYLKKRGSPERVRLSDFVNKKPVVLVFGTYTCPQFREQSRTLNDLAGMYNDEVEFLLIYIREAHPTDGWQDKINVKENVLLPEAKTLNEKDAHASVCVLKLGVKFTALIDEMDNRVEQAYSAWPNRLYIIGKDGRIAWKNRPGAVGFLPSELAVALEEERKREEDAAR